MSTIPQVSTDLFQESAIRARIAEMVPHNAQLNDRVADSSVLDNIETRQVEIATEIAYNNSRPKARTVCRILSKDKVAKAMTIGGLILAVEGFIKTIFADIVSIFVDLKKKAPKGILKFKTFFPLPFWTIDTLMSIYSIYDSSVHGHKAYKKQDKGGVYDHSLSVTANTLNIAANSALYASTAYTIKGAAGPAVAAGAAAGGLGIVFFTIFTMAHALNLKRVYKALSSIKAVLIKPNATPVEKCKAGLNSIKDQLFLTAEEKAKIAQTTTNIDERDLLIEMQLKRKFDILSRRVGAGLATELQASFGKRALFSRLDSEDLTLKKEAFKEGAALLNKYRITLNRQMIVRILKVTAGVLAIAACAASLATPPGAAIAAAVLFGAFFLLQTSAWYVGNKLKDENVYQLIDFAIPTVKELMRPYLKAVDVVVEKKVNEKMEKALEKRKKFMKSIQFDLSNWIVAPKKPISIDLPNPFPDIAVAS